MDGHERSMGTWISVEDSLPEPYTNKVLIFIAFGEELYDPLNDEHFQLAFRSSSGEWCCDNELVQPGKDDSRVTHWMRIGPPELN